MIRVGISVLTHPGQNVWSSGLYQNVFFLTRCIGFCADVCSVVWVDAGGGGHRPAGAESWPDPLPPLLPLDEAHHRLDVLIEMHGAVPMPWIERFRACGGRVALMECGNFWSATAEAVIFGRTGTWLGANRWDVIWTHPHHARWAPAQACLSRCPVDVVPYLWAPDFIAARLRAQPPAPPPSVSGWRVACAEPNISVVKNLLVPLLAADRAHRMQPEAVERVLVFCASHMAAHPTLVHLAQTLDLQRRGCATFPGRVEMAEILTQHADAMVSHQLLNELNYLALDVLHAGWPLVHNSEPLKSVGFYYEGCDIESAARRLLEARAAWACPSEREQRIEQGRRLAGQFDPRRADNVTAYGQRLHALVARAPARSPA